MWIVGREMFDGKLFVGTELRKAVMSRVRRLVLFLLIAGLGGPSCTSVENGFSTASKVDQMPQAHHSNGASIFVEAIENRGETVLLELLALNGARNSIRLNSSSDRMVLLDAGGKQLMAAKEDVSIEPNTASSIKIEFDGPLTASDGPVTLRINSKYGNEFTAPAFTIGNIPTSGRRIEFKQDAPFKVSLSDKMAHHANGTNLVLNEIGAGENVIEVSFQAVNGFKDEIRLTDGGTDRPFLQDDKANRYYLVPPANNQDLSIPARQLMSGVMRFVGRIPPSTQSLSLHLNERFGSDQEYAVRPRITINDIPVRR